MAPETTDQRVSLDSKGSKTDDHHVETSAPTEYLDRYPLIRDKTPEELKALEKSLVRKLDWKFLPMITMMLLMNYLDRINVSNARLAGMQTDLNMSDTQWSAGISMFYVGYIISQVPCTVFFAKGNPKILLPGMMLAWSAVTICMPAMKSGWSFILCRFLVGFTEGPFVPAVSLMTSSWYTKAESPLRMSIWHAGNIISNVISGFLAAGILTQMDGVKNIAAWKWFFIIEGSVSIGVALVSFWFMPKWPSTTGTYFITAEESEMAQYRQLVNAGGVSEDDEGGYWGGVALALRDPFTYMFMALHFCIIVAQSFKDFFPSILDTFHFGEMETYLLQAPPYIFSYIVCLALSWTSGRLLEHCWHIVGSMVMCLVGVVIMISTLETGPRYFSLFLLCGGPFVALNLHISWETSVVPRPRTKRAALVSLANCASSVTHWFSPYFFLTKQAPRYETGGGIIIAGCGASIIVALVVRWWCGRKNKQIEERVAATGEDNSWRFVT